MDPSQVQSDTSNNADSLSDGDDDKKPEAAAAPPSDPNKPDTRPGEEGVTDATGSDPNKAKASAPDPFQHRSFIRRLWDKFNIYLMLFVFVLVIAIGLVAVLTYKGRQDTTKTVSTQGLSQDALKQLANTDVTVGAPKQILTVQANAVFAGAVLIRGDLEVAGTLKLGGDMSLANLTVTGTSKMSEAITNNLTVTNSLSVQGALTLKSGISVSGQSNFNGGIVASSITTGALLLNGDLNLTHHIVAGGTIPAIVKGSAVGGGGTVSLSGSDTAGSININIGSAPPAGCFATVTFSEAFDNIPHVVVSPIGAAAAGLNYYITRSTTNFVICSTNAAAAAQDFGFDYVILD